MLLPCAIAVSIVTALVMGAAGLATQWVRRRGGREHE